MKKFLFSALTVILVLAVLASACVAVALFRENAKTDVAFAVITDPHVLAESQIGSDDTVADYIQFAKKGQKMLSLTQAILESTVDELIDNKVGAVLIPGDLTDDGGRDSHLTVASKLKKLTDAGIKVFVIPGDHDILNDSYSYVSGEAVSVPNIDCEDFAEIYVEFGYNLAIKRDEGSLSYTADIDDEYRLIAIDCVSHVTDENGKLVAKHYPAMTPRLLSWCEAQVEAAVSDGKTPVAIMHFPLGVHYGTLIGGIDAQVDKVNDYQNVAETLAGAGLHYVFSGHLHISDGLVVKTNKGNIYDFVTSALSNYPCAIRYIESTDTDFVMRTEGLGRLKAQYLPSYLPAAEKSSVVTDLQSYAKEYVIDSMTDKIYQKIDVGTLKKLLKYLGVEGEAAEVLAQDILDNMIKPFFNLKLYKKDAAPGEMSLESILENYGATLPASEFLDIKSFLMKTVSALFHGDESADANSDYTKIFKYALCSIFYFVQDFGLFDKIREVNPDFAEIDLSVAMDTLFTKYKLELIETNLLVGLMTSVPKVADILPMVASATPNQLMGILNAFQELEWMGIKPIQLLIDFEEDAIDIGAIADALFGKLGSGLTNDFSCPDNNLRINKTTLTWSQV